MYGNEKLTTLVHANFLGLNQAAFYHSLQCLHSVVLVPPASEASNQPIRIYHTSFSDYLRDKARAREFALDEEAIHFYVATRGLEWLGHCRKVPSDEEALPDITWPEDRASPHSQSILDSVCNFAFTPCWRAFPQVPEASLSLLIEVVKNFDFNITYSKWESETREFAYFTRWLVSSDAKTLASIDHTHADSGKPGKKEEIAVIWDEEDPRTFVEPFLRNTGLADCFSVHLQLRTCNQTSFHLIPSIYIGNVHQTREDDIVIVFMGTTESGKSYFIDLLTRWQGHHAWHSLTPADTSVRATRTIHPEYDKRIVLVDTPGFDCSTRSDIETLNLINNQLEEIYRNNVHISGIVYAHPITDDRTGASHLSILQPLSGQSGDQEAAHILLVTTMWEEIEPLAGEKREVQLKEGPWKDLTARGASLERLASGTEEEAWCILNKLLKVPNTGETLKEMLEFPLSLALRNWMIIQGTLQEESEETL